MFETLYPLEDQLRGAAGNEHGCQPVYLKGGAYRKGKEPSSGDFYYRIFSNKIRRINGTRQTGNTA
jgi:hypothetical protein